MIKFGEILKKYRRKNGLTQEEVAKRLNVTPTYISAVENNRKEPSLSLLNDICDALQLPKELLFWELITIDDSMTREDKKIVETAKKILGNYYESTLEAADNNKTTDSHS